MKCTPPGEQEVKLLRFFIGGRLWIERVRVVNLGG